MLIGRQLAIGRDSFQRVGFEAVGVTAEVIEDRWLENEEPAVDPAFTRDRFLGEVFDQTVVNDQAAESSRRTNGRHSGDLAVRLVVCQQFRQIDVTYTVTVGEHEGLTLEPIFEPEQATAGVCRRAGIDQIDGPIDVAASVLPFGAKSGQPLTVKSTSGKEVELRDDLANLILVAATKKLSKDVKVPRNSAALSHPAKQVLPLAQQNRELRRKTMQLERQLAQAQALLDLQKKVSQLLGITLATPKDDEIPETGS